MANRPWSELALHLESTHGDYADFVAWERWMVLQGKKHPEDIETLLGKLDACERVMLYGIMVDCCEREAVQP